MYPFVFAAGATAFYFLVSSLKPPRAARLLASLLWAAYAVYEYHVANGTLCDKDCNIRVDLVLFLPLLASAAYLALKTSPNPATVAFLYAVCLGLTAWGLAAFGQTAAASVAGAGGVIAALFGIRSAFMAPRL